MIAAKPFADLDKKWAPTELAATNFIRVVYNSLAKPAEAHLLFGGERQGLFKSPENQIVWQSFFPSDRLDHQQHLFAHHLLLRQ